ncbi:unnamed protein product [Calicophoron daubneyi]|uniref:Rho-GAP domain-containing protein n=1 Tax=Calicophoron daubneyi TaxID=300641 RepID=A0AAV2TES3_CALDB
MIIGGAFAGTSCPMCQKHLTIGTNSDNNLVLPSLNYAHDSDSSGFVSSTASSTTSSEPSTEQPSPKSSPDSVRSPELRESRTYNRRNSSGRKIAKIINALTPCHGRIARRSHSFAEIFRSSKITGPEWKGKYALNSTVCGSKLVGLQVEELLPNLSLPPKPASLTALTTAYSSCSTQLDLFVTEPTAELREFRRRWPGSFMHLVANYLGFLTFSPTDMEQIRDALVKEAKYTAPCELQSNSSRVPGSLTPQKPTRSREPRNIDKELEHWYLVINIMIKYLIDEERYKCRFILRRPGNHSTVNELERTLFPPRHRPLSLSMKTRSASQADERLHHPAMTSEVHEILSRYEPSVVACLLARALRHRGAGLIPTYLRRLFLQLVSGVKENEVHQRRSIRLLLQLTNRKLVLHVLQPLFELLARIASSPECEVDENSLAVLFSPIFFLDRSTTNPASLANPLPARVVQLFVSFARSEYAKRQTISRLFQVPRLFVEDCNQNYRAHLAFENPPLYCSLKYCVTMTPSPRSQGKKTQESSDKTKEQFAKVSVPSVNLTSAFLAKRARHYSPNIPPGSSTPVLKVALHGPVLDFRVRRTPTAYPRSHSKTPLTLRPSEDQR